MSLYLTDSADLTAVANAIRTKGGTSSQLAFPAGFVDAIDAIETGGATGWQRPEEWPNYDLLNLQEESCFFTFDNRQKGGRYAIYVGVTSGQYRAQRVVITSAGDVEVVETSDYNSGAVCSGYLPTDGDDYIVIRVMPVSGHIVTISMNSFPSAANSTVFDQMCVERYGYLPYCTKFGVGYAYRDWSNPYVQSDTFLSVPENVTYHIANCFSLANFPMTAFTKIKIDSLRDCFNLKSFDFNKLDLSETTSLGYYFANCAVEECDLSQCVPPENPITSITALAGTCTARTVKLGAFNFSETAVSNDALVNNLVNVADFGSFNATIGARFIASTTRNLRAIVLRANTVVPLGASGNIAGRFLTRGVQCIFVPQELLEDYKVETNWSTLYATYPNMFAAIEGSEFE